MSSMIITDTEALHTVSTPAAVVDGQASEDTQKIIRELVSTIPNDAAGLSAPQINFFKRVFVANFPENGLHVFVNPIVKQTGGQTTSYEGCLSLPGVQRNIFRSSEVEISADIIYKVNSSYKNMADSMPYFDDLVETVSTAYDQKITYSDLDAFIVQHEFDHLEGVLITDHDEFVPRSEEVMKKLQDRHQRIQQKRFMKKQANRDKAQKNQVKPNPKKAAKLDKSLKKSQKRREKQLALQIEMQERQRAIEAGTIKSE